MCKTAVVPEAVNKWIRLQSDDMLHHPEGEVCLQKLWYVVVSPIRHSR